MGADYKPGTVAKATVNDTPNTLVVRRDCPSAHRYWLAPTMDDLGPGDVNVTDVRPLVVLDPEAPEIRDFVAAHALGGEPKLCCSQPVADLIAEQTKPPRIPEPGLWGVVEAATNFPTRRWVHHEEERWISDTGAILRWEDLRDPVLIREGVQ